jgi:hypothetical protein
VDMPQYLEDYVEQLLTCLMVLQRWKPVLSPGGGPKATLVSSPEQQSFTAEDVCILPKSTTADNQPTPVAKVGDEALLDDYIYLKDFSLSPIDLTYANLLVKEEHIYSSDIIAMFRSFIWVVEFLDGKILFDGLNDSSQPKTVLRQAISWYELLMHSLRNGSLLQAVLLQSEVKGGAAFSTGAEVMAGLIYAKVR